MQATTVLEIPLDDGSISRAMADLNAKLSLWATALSQRESKRTRPKPLPAATRTRNCTVAARPEKAAAVCGTSSAHAKEPYFGNVPVAEVERAKPAKPKLASAETSAAGTYTDVLAQDDALLATLDADVANAIRIQRRLCGPDVPISELVEKYQQDRPGVAITPKRPGRFWKWGQS